MKQTIVHIIPRFCFGGAERLVLLYAQMMDYDRFDVHVVCCVEDGDLRALLEQTRAHIFVASRAQYGGRLGAWRALHQYLKKVQPDIVHTHLISSDVVGFFYRLFAKKRPIWISTQHNVEDHRPWVYRFIWRMLLPTADGVIAVAPRVADYAQKTFHVAKTKLHLVLNGILVEKWHSLVATEVCQNNTLQIATIGRLETQKGHTYALSALAQLPATLLWQYHIYGEGALEVELREQATRLGIMDRIVWHGVVSTMECELGAIDIVLQPSLFEGLSLVVLEAMAAGRCVVTTPAGGEGVITSGVDGYIVPFCDASAIVQTIISLHAHRDGARTVAQSAGTLAEKKFDIILNVGEVQQIYRSFLHP